MISVEPLLPSREAEYEQFILSLPNALIYLSLKYRKFLQAVLRNAEPRYLIALSGNRIVGALPGFLASSKSEGKIYNSLPFFGGHGGLAVSESENRPEVKRLLLRALKDLEEVENVRSSVIVSSPLDEDHEFYVEELSPTAHDWRVGQILQLPAKGPSAVKDLVGAFHPKTRNAVRKGEKGGFAFQKSWDAADFVWLQALHAENMMAVGAASKPLYVFDEIKRIFAEQREFDLYVATEGSKRVAGLLVLYFNRRAEYYTPAVLEDFRESQVMSALIFFALQDAIKKECLQWNWGGTSPHNANLHRFKARWGSRDFPYHYYVRLRDRSLESLRPETVLAEFPGFYAYPFGNVAATHQ